MSHVIYKYELPSSPGNHDISMYKGARILGFGSQNDRLVIWAIVNPAHAYESRSFVIHFTGREFLDAIQAEDPYIGTIQLGPLVFHLFERRRRHV